MSHLNRISSALCAASLLFVFGCNSPGESETTPTADTIAADTAEHHDHNEPLTLNEGKKWPIVPDMLQHIRRVEASLGAFNRNSDKNLETYQKLAVEVDVALDSLTSNCTMTGAAHDELHKWLVPFLDLSSELDVVEDTAQGADVVTRMNQAFTEFNLYFE